MSFTREELINIAEAGFDYGGELREYLGNPAVAEIWNALSPQEQKDFARSCVLAEAIRMLEGERRRYERMREAEEEKRLKEQRAKRRAARKQK
jgi:hypothetical protein